MKLENKAYGTVSKGIQFMGGQLASKFEAAISCRVDERQEDGSYRSVARFAVNESSLPDNVEPTHRSLFDGTLQGISIRGQPAFSFQGHPEASPGPHDLLPLFERFLHDMRAAKRTTVKAMFST